MMVCAIGFTAFAQTVTQKDHKVKRTSSIGEKAHNTFSKHKHYNGYKVKDKRMVNGHEVKEKKKVVKEDR